MKENNILIIKVYFILKLLIKFNKIIIQTMMMEIQ